MMSITEEIDDSSDEDGDENNEKLPTELEMLIKDEHLRHYIKELLLTAEDLDILDTIQPESRPRSSSWDKTKQTTAKYKPVYMENVILLGAPV